MAKSRKLLTVGALGVAAAALIATGSGVTGAYFTDSHGGSINASSGDVKVEAGDLALNFTGLLPGVFPTNDVTYTATGSGPEDIWLVLPTDGTAAAFNGIAGGIGAGAALGAYGHFAVVGPEGSFTSFNLTTAGTTPNHTGSSCPVNPVTGWGGSITQAAFHGDLIDFCPVPNAILLSTGLGKGDAKTAHITFGYTKIAKGPNTITGLAPVAQFKIVATQPGILPTDINNP